MTPYKLSIIIFYDEQGRVLLQDRRNISRYGEDWGFFGGRIESGETSEATLVREIKEELDFDLLNYSFDKEHIFSYKDVYEVHAFMFYAPLPTDCLKTFTVNEGAGMKLFSEEECKNLNIINGGDMMLEHFFRNKQF